MGHIIWSFTFSMVEFKTAKPSTLHLSGDMYVFYFHFFGLRCVTDRVCLYFSSETYSS